ncbi:hypothetical protein MCRO_0531 [Mycoplasma crocodyli MP145]|uniref:Lipoprotein-associated type-17 domain-containing protein n=2 Tax=Mycoplasma TaxID=2093 RepID=D5E5V8_MYCCM|nr:hypothetical protein MCRO_0531 [Mycoplasma crocodyli MP145]
MKIESPEQKAINEELKKVTIGITGLPNTEYPNHTAKEYTIDQLELKGHDESKYTVEKRAFEINNEIGEVSVIVNLKSIETPTLFSEEKTLKITGFKPVPLGKIETMAKNKTLFIVDKSSTDYATTIEAIKKLIGPDGKGKSYIKQDFSKAQKASEIIFKYGDISKNANSQNNVISFLKYTDNEIDKTIGKNISCPKNYDDGKDVKNRRALFFSLDENGKLIIKFRVTSETNSDTIYTIDLE